MRRVNKDEPVGCPEVFIIFIPREEGGDKEMNELVALNTVNRIWTRLEGVLAYRQNIKKYTSLIGNN